MRTKFKFGNYYYGFSLNVWQKRWVEAVVGYSNKVVVFKNDSIEQKEENFILTLDIDKKEGYKDLKREIQKIQIEYLLGDFFVFETLNGYHVVCLDLLSLGSFIEIMLKFSFIDKKHFYIPILNTTLNWILRISPKNGEPIKYIEVIKSEYNQRFKSYPHSILLEDVFGIESSGRLKGSDSLIMAKYRV